MDSKSRRAISLYRRLIDISFVIDAWRARIKSHQTGGCRNDYMRILAQLLKRQNKIQAEFNLSIDKFDNEERNNLSYVLTDFIEIAKMSPSPFMSSNEHLACLKWVIHALHTMRAW